MVVAQGRATLRRRRRPSGITCIPSRDRSSTNHSNSSGGSMRSTTTVIGWPRSAIQRPAHSHPPRWASAMIAPFPSSSASRSSDSRPPRTTRRRPAWTARQAEALQPVPGVGVERVLHGPTQPQPAQRRVDAPEVSFDHRPPFGAGEVGPSAERGDQAGATTPGIALAASAPQRYPPVVARSRTRPTSPASPNSRGRPRARSRLRPGGGGRAFAVARCEHTRALAAGAPHLDPGGGDRGDSACLQTLTKRWIAVIEVRASITQRIGISSRLAQQARRRWR